MSSGEFITIPDRLPVLALPYPLVLHPSLLLSIPLSYAHSLSLLKAALQATTDTKGAGNSTHADSQKPIVIACVPTLRVPAGSSSASADKSTSRELALKPSQEDDPRVRINDLFDWGCAAKLVRLTRNPASQTCTLLVTGVARVRIDRWLSVRAPLTSTALDSARNLTVPDVPVPLAAITPFVDEGPYPAPGVTGAEAKVHAQLRAAAEELLDALTTMSAAAARKAKVDEVVTAMPQPGLPLLPPALLRRVRAFVRDSKEGQTGLLADVLVGTLGGACEWSERVQVLGDWDPRVRVQHATKVLADGAARVRLARELVATLSAPLSPNSKEALLRTQLEALLTQLAALNPNTNARITTGNSTFSIGPVTKGGSESSNSNNKVGGIITIRPPGRSNESAPPRTLGGGRGQQGDEEEEDELAELTAKLAKAQMTPEARRVCDKELKRLSRIPPQSVERGVIITYLETMAELPWDKTSEDLQREQPGTDRALPSNEGIVERARRILDEDHYGLEKIKKRLVEYLAVLELKTAQAEERAAEEEAEERKNKKHKAVAPAGGRKVGGETLAEEDEDDDASPHLEHKAEAEEKRREEEAAHRIRRRKAAVGDKGPILLLVGPPGTGKTSIARSLATALQRPFTRLSLGGVRDEAEIRGHRRTYVGAMAGNIASSLRKVGVSDPVLLLDEVDKLGSGNGLHGDPMAAMLEVLDPEQNHSFNDHYINCPMDLSRVLFIATANSLDTISPPLLDRTEVIQVSGYTHDEKVAIARNYLLPKQIKAQGLKKEDLKVGDEVLLKVAMSYTREAGVRSLEREIGSIARYKAVQYAEARKGAKDKDGKPKVYDPVVRVEDLEEILGVDSYDPEVADIEARPGVATGLAYQGSGSGGILHIESLLMPPGNGNIKLTGSLGDVIRESAELAYSWVKGHAYQLGITQTRDASFPNNDVHLHLPGGAVPKDGPSAGVAMTCALVSLFTRTPISPKLAMTGEISLRGRVMPVGGIKEKCLGAHRAGIEKVILPARNRKDAEADLPQNVKSQMQIVYVSNIWQALEAAFGHALFEGDHHFEGIKEGRRLMSELVHDSRL